jgi:hypothetical protein
MVGRRHHVLTEIMHDASLSARGGALKVADHAVRTVQMIEHMFDAD